MEGIITANASSNTGWVVSGLLSGTRISNNRRETDNSILPYTVRLPKLFAEKKITHDQ